MKLKNVKRGRMFGDGENNGLKFMRTRSMKTKHGNAFNCICVEDEKKEMKGELLFLEPDTDVSV